MRPPVGTKHAEAAAKSCNGTRRRFALRPEAGLDDLPQRLAVALGPLAADDAIVGHSRIPYPFVYDGVSKQLRGQL